MRVTLIMVPSGSGSKLGPAARCGQSHERWLRPHAMSPRRDRHANVPTLDHRPGALHMKKLALVLLLAAFSGHAQAQPAWPTRPITMVVPYPAGGTADLL